MTAYSIVSTDCHIVEPPGTFIERVPAHLKDRAPRVMRGADGGDGWSLDGNPPKTTFGLEATAGRAPKEYQRGGLTWEQVLPGCYNGEAHLKDMAFDGVDASVVFPAVSVVTYVMDDRELGLACLRAYNDWLRDDFCAPDPDRLIGLYLLPVDDGMPAVVGEIERMVGRGARAFFIPGYPAVPYHLPYYDDMWRALEQAGTPVAFHRSHGGKAPAHEQLPSIIGVGATGKEISNAAMLSGMVVRFFSAVAPFTNMIFTGVFDRFPRLKVMAGEVNCGWVPFWQQTMDQIYETERHWAGLDLALRPSEYFGRNAFVTVLDDWEGFRQVAKDESLARGVMYSTDYPHAVTIWPRTKELVPELTAGMSAEARQRVLAGNAIEVFRLPADND